MEIYAEKKNTNKWKFEWKKKRKENVYRERPYVAKKIGGLCDVYRNS